MNALNRKVLRQLRGLWAQGSSIALVVAGGIATLVIATSTLATLERTQARFYAEQRFAEVFASLERAPERLAARIAELPGVGRVETRVVASVKLAIPGFGDPATGLIVSLPDTGEPALNRLWLQAGSLPEPGRGDLAVVSEAFAEAHDFAPGDRFEAIINGRWQRLTISGIALSPEYIYQIRPGDMFPDFQRYGILWMRRDALASAYDMDGAFNNVTLDLAGNAQQEEIIARLDELLARYGGVGAYAREDQTSHRYVTQEIAGLETMAGVFPVIFLGVAAFLLNIVLSRLMELEREEIGMLKAFGYSDREVAVHYLKLVLAIVMAGALAGIGAGAWLGGALSGVYREYYRFPYLDYELGVAPVLVAFAVAAGAAVVGAMRAIAAAVRLPPAEAMRPAAPAVYRRTVLERLGLASRFDQATRMILRYLNRHPLKALASVTGVALSVAVMMVGSFQEDAIDYMTRVEFEHAALEDMTVTFEQPRSRAALHAISSTPGVHLAEPFRAIGARLHFGHRGHRTAVLGLPVEPVLHHTLGADLEPVRPPPGGMLITDFLADMLGASPGDFLTVEFLEGRRLTRQVELSGVVDQFVGLSAYMQLESLNRLAGEGDVVSGAYLAVDEADEAELFGAFRDAPAVASVSIKARAVESFMRTMDKTVLVFAFVNTMLAGSIAFGVVYASASVALSERRIELASLRVLGLTRAEVGYILLGELGLIVLLALVPGFLIGRALCAWFAAQIGSEIYRVPLVTEASTYAFSATVVIAAALVSGWIVKRRLDKVDLVSALKTGE